MTWRGDERLKAPEEEDAGDRVRGCWSVFKKKKDLSHPFQLFHSTTAASTSLTFLKKAERYRYGLILRSADAEVASESVVPTHSQQQTAEEDTNTHKGRPRPPNLNTQIKFYAAAKAPGSKKCSIATRCLAAAQTRVFT